MKDIGYWLKGVWTWCVNGLLWASLGLVLSGCNPALEDLNEFDNPNAAASDLVSESSEPGLFVGRIRKLLFKWTPEPGATHYRVSENKDGESGFFDISGDLGSNTSEFEIEVPLFRTLNAQYDIERCVGTQCSSIGSLTMQAAIKGEEHGEPIGFLKGTSTDIDDALGASIAVSGDGKTVAVGAPFAQDAQLDVFKLGAVYVYANTGVGQWELQARLVDPHLNAPNQGGNTGKDDEFGYSVSLNFDGNVLAIGSPMEDSDQADVSVSSAGQNDVSPDSGAAYVFTRTNGVWSQQAYLKASNNQRFARFGASLSLNKAGDRLAVGAPEESKSSTIPNTGAVYVFSSTAAIWAEESRLVATNQRLDDQFGYSVSLSGDGNTLAAGAVFEDFGSSGAHPDFQQVSTLKNGSGAVYVFAHTGANWDVQSYVKASNPGEDDHFGTSLALSENGNRLVIGAPGESSNAIGLLTTGAGQNDNSAESGAVYVYQRSGTLWAEQSYLKAANNNSGDSFGTSLSLSYDGQILAVGAPGDDVHRGGLFLSAAGFLPATTAVDSGAVHVFNEANNVWAEMAYVKATSSGSNDHFGNGVALSGKANLLAVGAPGEDSRATNVSSNSIDTVNDFKSNTGAAYLY